MSQRKSRLGVRKPIGGMGKLGADVSKYNMTNDFFLRMVETSTRLPNSNDWRIKFIECGHEATWIYNPELPQLHPSTWELCPICRRQVLALLDKFLEASTNEQTTTVQGEAEASGEES